MLLKTINNGHPKLSVSTRGEIKFLSTDDIVRLQASGNYTRIFVKDKPAIIISKSLKVFDDMLQQAGFLRTHQSHLVNPQYISSLSHQTICMSDGTLAAISRRKRHTVLSTLKTN